MKNEKGFIEIMVGIIIGLVILFCLFVLYILAIDFIRTTKYSVGWVWVERKGTAVKEFIKEEDGCVYFIDIYDMNVKTCGIYQIKTNN